MYKWQQEILNRMAKFKGQGMTLIAGRNVGKSIMTAQAVERLKDDLGPYKLTVDLGKVSGDEYHTVQPVGWMHAGDNHQWHSMVGWCVETFGPTTDDGIWTPSQRWYVNNAKFWFRDVKDRDWFILKWS